MSGVAALDGSFVVEWADTEISAAVCLRYDDGLRVLGVCAVCYGYRSHPFKVKLDGLRASTANLLGVLQVREKASTLAVRTIATRRVVSALGQTRPETRRPR